MALIPDNYLPQTIRGIHIALMNEFRDLYVRKFDSSGNIIQTIRVPVVMSMQEKYQALIKERESGQKYYLPYPKMSLTWSGITYNGERAGGVNVERNFFDPDIPINDLNTFITDVSPVPYDLSFELDIQTESLSDYTQILESVLPFFDPARHIRIKEFRFLNIERDLKIRLDGISNDFLIDQEETVRRQINGTLSMTVEAFMFTPFPLDTSAGDGSFRNTKVIKEIRTRYYPELPEVLPSVSAIAGYNTSGWDSSASFPAPYDISGVYSASDDFSFEYYIDDMFN